MSLHGNEHSVEKLTQKVESFWERQHLSKGPGVAGNETAGRV